MGYDQVAVTTFGIALVSFIYWFFFMKNEPEVVAEAAEIVVDGGYTPNAIRAKCGKALTLTFLRKDPSPCLEELVLPDFGIRKYLPINQRVQVTVMPKHTGEFSFRCGMNMFHGKIVAI